jgi:hypothetical protein
MRTQKYGLYLGVFITLALLLLLGIIAVTQNPSGSSAQGTTREERARSMTRLPSNVLPETLATRGLPTPVGPIRTIPSVVPTPLISQNPITRTQLIPNPTIRNATEFAQHLSRQKDLLQRYAGTDNQRILDAGVTFKRSLNQAELDQILKAHEFNLVAFDWVGTNNAHGSFSTRAVQNLSQTETKLKESDPSARMLGIVFVVGRTQASQLRRFDQHPEVVLVDIRDMEMIDQMIARGQAVNLPPPLNLYEAYRTYNAQSTPTPRPSPTLKPYP